MDTSTICAILLAALITLSLPISHLELIVYPRDTEVLINHSAYFNCSTSIRNEQIHWYHYRVRENRTNYVYYKGEFNKNYPNRYSVMINKETGEYNLIISSVQPIDAGRYVCQDDGGLGRSSSAELIVLDSLPVCQSNTQSYGLVGPNSCGIPIDELRLSCIVSYSGNIPPIIQWKMDGNEAPILRGITSDHSRTRITLNLTESSEVAIGRVLFTCGTRSLDKKYSCTPSKVKVNYAFDEPAILNITKGETVTCSANASVPCTYRWFYGNDTLCPASCDHVLTTTRLEDYSCEASCTINGIRCTFVAMRIFVDESPHDSERTTMLLVVILIPIVVVLLVIILVLSLKHRKERAVTRKLARDNSVLLQTVMQSRGQECLHPVTTCDANYGVEMQHLLADVTYTIIPCTKEQEIITKASKEMGKTIAGVAILQDLIYVVSDQSSEVETFNLKTLKFKNCSNVKELVNPWDLASCTLNNCLYIMDRGSATEPCYVTRVDSDVKFFAKWPTAKEYGNLSVTSDGRVVVTLCDSSRLFIYNPDGIRMEVVSLSEDLIHPSHAIELSNGQFLISYGLNDDNVHRICIIDRKNEIAKNSFSRMESPSYLAVDETGSIFVADQGNSRVCLFDSDLELKGEMASKNFELRCPHRICLVGKTGKLIVADNDLKNFKRRKGKLLIFKYKL